MIGSENGQQITEICRPYLHTDDIAPAAELLPYPSWDVAPLSAFKFGEQLVYVFDVFEFSSFDSAHFLLIT